MLNETMDDRLIKSSKILKNITNWSWMLAGIVSIFQVLFFYSIENVICIINVLTVWFFSTKYIFKPINLAKYPISLFIILSFTLTQFYFPLIFTTIEFKSLINNLKFPLDVFIHSDLAFFVLIIAHLLYRSHLALFRINIQSKIKIFQIFNIPNKSEIWIIGYFGLIAFFFGQFNGGSSNINNNGFQKLLVGSSFLAYMPYLLPCSVIFGSQEKIKKSDYIRLVIHTIIIVLLGIGINKRGDIMIGIVSVGLVYSLGIILGVFEIKILTKRNLTILALGIYLFTGPLSDLGTAIVIVRAKKNEISKEELISQTFKAYFDKEEIEKYNKLTQARLELGEWDEKYLNNIFLTRFCNLKFNDLSLEQAYLVGESDYYFDFTVGKIWGTLPAPIIDFFNVNIDKSNLNKKSFGDVLFMIGGAGDEVLGGFRAGHFAGTGLVTFGWWYLLILGITMIPIYLLFDIFVVSQKLIINNEVYQQNYIGVCILVNILSVFQFLPSESVITNITFIIRGWFQMLFLYGIFFYVAKRISKVF